MDGQIDPAIVCRAHGARGPFFEALGNNTSTAKSCIAAKARRHDHKPDLPPAGGRSVRRSPL